MFADDTAIAADKIKLRFVHASPGTPGAVDVGLGSGAGFQRVFANVVFGKVTVHPLLDNGYVEAAPLSSAIAARLAGGSSDALVVPHVTLEGGSISTAFAIGGKTAAADLPRSCRTDPGRSRRPHRARQRSPLTARRRSDQCAGWTMLNTLPESSFSIVSMP